MGGCGLCHSMGPTLHRRQVAEVSQLQKSAKYLDIRMVSQAALRVIQVDLTTQGLSCPSYNVGVMTITYSQGGWEDSMR